jgi:FkbM family methyltransferase
MTGQSPLHGHGQFGEDTLLSHIFSKKNSGVCLEVGAFDGITGSATHAFEIKGWTAILVEPLPEMAESIRKLRHGPFYPVAAGEKIGTVQLHRSLRDPAVSSTGDNHWQNQLYAIRSESTETLEVEMKTLDWILEQSGVSRVDFATIDVEGQEMAVLQGWTLSKWKPRVLILEDNSRGLDDQVWRYLHNHGYRAFHHTGVNDWYAHRTDRELVTLSNTARMKAHRAWRRVRHQVKRFFPAPLKSMLRKTGLVGE